MASTKTLLLKLGRTTLFLNVPSTPPQMSTGSILRSFHGAMISSNSPSPSAILAPLAVESESNTEAEVEFPSSWTEVDPQSDLALYRLGKNDDGEKVFQPCSEGAKDKVEIEDDEVFAVAVRAVGADKIGKPIVKLADEEEDDDDEEDGEAGLDHEGVEIVEAP
ncbi:uncharacterized protein PFL1_05225 [Pseudozyma flocculosa PF-1]|uniref:Uncharacterized protein n=2 Tax=Pseudozyma flocculosa TaxID=84751 RepID=A0A5C3F596_9BASI|nr:uncharacterized protein PFL1_05225 [Pseudozyma flocculosa PF-1]EPQ27303.1 hypothetical protein PFL1_05225 [Pseudozyma flocculosa PF-1]SPO39674.1 uncharacterized protein PSFLO_05155 [Pseudozyma flocculosa]